MSITYESAYKRYRDAREEYERLESQLVAVRAKMNAAERECSVELRKLLDEQRAPNSGVRKSET